jgi:uncharacterized DUF497 family protein
MALQWQQNDRDAVRIYELVIEPGREEHISYHRVRVSEVEEVAFGRHSTFRARQGYYGLVGQTNGGRYLTVVVAPRGGGVYGLVTARDADDAERRLYRQ